MVRISVVIPTRGDVDMQPIRDRLSLYGEIDDIHIVTGDGPYIRYEEAANCRHGVILTQDDDCLTDLRPVIDSYEPGIIVNAMTEAHAANYPNQQTLVGFGAIFDRDLISCLDDWERDDLFKREADRVFTALIPHKTVFPHIEMLPWASSENRMYRQPEHFHSLREINKRILMKSPDPRLIDKIA